MGATLERYRYNSEWYQVDLSVIVHAINAAAISQDGIIRYSDRLEAHDIVKKLSEVFEGAANK